MKNDSLSPQQSKLLVHAARYLDAVHDVQIDENSENLHSLIKEQVKKINSKQLHKYWNEYIALNSVQLSEIDEKANKEKKDDDDDEEYFYFKGIKMLKG